MRRSVRRLLCQSIVAVTLAAGLGGCGEDFDPYNRLTSAAGAGHPGRAAGPGPGETTTLSALVYTPAQRATRDASRDLRLELVPAARLGQRGLPLPDQRGGAAGHGRPGAGLVIPPLDLGTGATAQLPHTLNPADPGSSCAPGCDGLPQTLDCEGGFPVQVKLSGEERQRRGGGGAHAAPALRPGQRAQRQPAHRRAGGRRRGGRWTSPSTDDARGDHPPRRVDDAAEGDGPAGDASPRRYTGKDDEPAAGDAARAADPDLVRRERRHRRGAHRFVEGGVPPWRRPSRTSGRPSGSRTTPATPPG